MFDPGIIHYISDTNIDRPYNAITLTHTCRRYFGGLQVYFEAETGSLNTYTIKTTKEWYLPNLPVTRTLFVTSDHNIDPPMPRLLAIHRACCLILHLSGAGQYLDRVLRDMEEGTLISLSPTSILQSFIDFITESSRTMRRIF